MSGASALQTATVDGGTPVSGRRARTLSRRAGEAGAVCAAAGSGDAVQAAAGALLAMAAVAEAAAAVAGGLVAQGAPVEAPVGVHGAPLVPPSLPLLPMSLCYHLRRWWTPVSDVCIRNAHVMVPCGCVACTCCATHSCSACSLSRARRAVWLVVSNPMWRSRRGSRSAGDVVEEKLYSDRLLDLVYQYGKKAAVYVCSEHTRLQGPRCTR